MTEFTSKWLTWESPETSRVRTDKTAKSPPATLETLRVRTDKTDRSPFGSSVSSNSARSQGNVATEGKAAARRDVNRWDLETASLIEWFMATEPPLRPFRLQQGVTVAVPTWFWEYLKGDIAAGPRRARGKTGALRDDLRRLHKLFGGE